MARTRLAPACFAIALVAPCVAATAAAADWGKTGFPTAASEYSFFNPVPDDKLRPFSADRPNRTFSTSTIDVGRFQIESDIANIVADESSKTRTFSLGSPILRVGITPDIELQVGTTLFTRTKRGTIGDEIGDTVRGVGSTLVGTKVNLFGNDGGDQSMAVVVQARLPSFSRELGPERIEGSIDLPFTTTLGSSAWQLTLQPHFSLLGNEDNSSYRDHYGFAAQISYAISSDLTVGLEFASYAWRDVNVYSSSSLDLSLSWKVSRNTQIDGAVYFGLDRETPSINPYIGVSHRF